MLLLAIDSSSVTASAALVRQRDAAPNDGCGRGILLSEAFINNGLTHSQTLAPMIDGVLKNAGVLPGELTQIVVTNGPGSFTGLRIGVASALGFSAALGIPCAGVSSLMAAAYGATDHEGTVCAAMDARRGQIYCAMFHVKQTALTRLTADQAVDREAFCRQAPPSVCWVGDAALQCAREGDRPSSRPYISGYGAALCFLNGHSRPVEQIEYLRVPQAERERLARGES
ncbi:MAG: tRNA (adenosine(37)-N6)-threonylcarbamoyltransferase complex dimerization subunit type 1 TsaB [Oscillospiraceae bacterium]|nr:tRNA (adenosine(37)-N6)-threonylcarbamoyltransferase complex dimerization subunit type 1 TsaB [Oscillospiraceae bacterium]